MLFLGFWLLVAEVDLSLFLALFFLAEVGVALAALAALPEGLPAFLAGDFDLEAPFLAFFGDLDLDFLDFLGDFDLDAPFLPFFGDLDFPFLDELLDLDFLDFVAAAFLPPLLDFLLDDLDLEDPFFPADLDFLADPLLDDLLLELDLDFLAFLSLVADLDLPLEADFLDLDFLRVEVLLAFPFLGVSFLCFAAHAAYCLS